MAKRQEYDWEPIERDVRAGVLSYRQISAKYGGKPSHDRIRKEAEKNGWERNLGARIRAEADARVARREAEKVALPDPERVRLTEKQVVDANAETSANVMLAHRADITRTRRLVMRLLDECEAGAADQQALQDLGEMMREPDEFGRDKLNDVYRKVITLPERIVGIKDLTAALKNLVEMERKAYKLDELNEKPQEEEKYDPREAARRLAFILAQEAHRSAA